ncbi:hypothetical protein C8R45DRAFT_1123658, partial [Mycena sanguinolenta]
WPLSPTDLSWVSDLGSYLFTRPRFIWPRIFATSTFPHMAQQAVTYAVFATFFFHDEKGDPLPKGNPKHCHNAPRPEPCQRASRYSTKTILYPMPLNNLPNEIIYGIMQLVPPSDQAALCSTSKLLHDVGVPILYRAVVVSSEASVRSFCSTLLANPAKFSGLVRSFSVLDSPDYSSRQVGNSEAMRLNDERRSSRDNSLWLLPDCCKALHKLENLTLDCFELDEVWEKLLACAFPNLVRCRLWACGLGPWSYVSAGAMIVSFLIRHPGLKSVWIQFEVPDFEAWPSISMPNVEHLRAPASFLSSVTDHRLKEVWIDWLSDEVQPVELPPASETLKSLTRTDVPLVLCIDCSDDRVAEIMYAASRQIPHTRTLQMGLSNDHYVGSYFLMSALYELR